MTDEESDGLFWLAIFGGIATLLWLGIALGR